MGIQGHLDLRYPFPDFQGAITTFANLGVDVAITELDVRMPLSGGRPTGDQLATQGDWYGKVVAACAAVPRCVSITLWGTPDTYSWVPSFFPDEGAATVFADSGTPKPAFDALVTALRKARA